MINKESIDLMNEFVNGVLYVGEIRDWTKVKETYSSPDDEGGGGMYEPTTEDLEEGGASSGNWGHRGRPGQKGGSGAGGGAEYRLGDYKRKTGEPTGLSASAKAILKQYEDSAKATFIEGKSEDQLKVDISKRLGKRTKDISDDMIAKGKMSEFFELNEFIKYAAGDVAPGPADLKVHEEAARQLIRQWEGTSGDSNPRSIMMQLAAQKEFGLKNTSIWWKPDKVEKATKLLETHDKPARMFLREMYNDTQEHLAKQGLKTVRLARGYHGDIGISPSSDINPIAKANIRLQPMTSFSASTDVAMSFSRMAGNDNRAILFSEFPASRILSCPVTGYGCKKEFEYVVLGNRSKSETMLGSFIPDLKRAGNVRSWSKIFTKDVESGIMNAISKGSKL